MAGKDDDDKAGARSIDDIEREVDRMEEAESGGETGSPFVGAADDDVEVVVAAEDDDGQPINVDELNREEERREELDQPLETAKPEEDEVAGYSEKVRRRIMRERDLRKGAEDREEAERAARISAQSQLHATQLNASEITLSMVDSQIKDREAALKVAKDGGKIDDDIKLTGELSELRARKTEVERVRDHLKSVKHEEPNPLVHRWERENRWYNNPEFLAESAAVRTISAQLAKKFPANTDEHFEEVNKELQRRMPNLESRVKARLGQDAIRWNGSQAREEREQPRRQAPKLAAPSGGFGRSSAGKRQIVITRTDMESMRSVRLDPNNKTHVLQYAREKAALANNK